MRTLTFAATALGMILAAPSVRAQDPLLFTTTPCPNGPARVPVPLQSSTKDWPEATAKGWTVVSMKDDWRAIFPP
jgi:hypothetical protein